MQMVMFPRNPIFKNIPEKISKQQQKFFPYKTHNFRWNEYRRSKISGTKKANDQKINQTRQQTKQIVLLTKQQKDNPEKQRQISINQTEFKSPLFLKKSFNKIVDQPLLNEIKLPPSILQPVSLLFQSEKQSPEFKLSSLKQSDQRRSKEKQTLFRKTFCSSLNKANYKNRSLQIKSLQKRPPTTNQQIYRPVTRIRKVSNIGDQSNGNFLAKYQIIKQLGKGTYGTVHLAKIIKKKILKPNLLNTTFFNSFKGDMTLNKSQNVIVQNKGPNVDYFASITQNVSFANQTSKNQQKQYNDNINLGQMQTINSQNKQNNIPINRSDNQIDIQNQTVQNNSTLKQNEKQVKSVNQQQNLNNQDDDQLVAIKVYEKFKMNKDPAKFKNIRKQITIMQNLNHPGVIKLYESVQSITKISLVVQFGGQMSLLDYLRKHYPLTNQKLKDFSKQLLDVIIYLHQKNIVHRDIKPQNILVKVNKHTNQQTLKLIDYGFSTLTNKSRKLNVICGTPNFMAPQLLSSKQYFGEKADVWSFGVVTFVMAEGRHPFKSSQYAQLTRIVNKGKYIFKKKHQPLFEQFIGQILKINSDQRPTAMQISKFKWLQQQ